MFTCFGLCGSSEDGDQRERQPLLPRYNDETTLQNRLHEKLHTYQMLRALGKGYMPSNEQTIINLRTLLSADILSPNTTGISDSGRALVLSTRLWIQQFIELLQHKNADDQIQDFIWYLSQARLQADTYDLAERASRAKVKADTAAAYKSLQTVGSLLLTNSDFRIFLSDLTTVGREVFRDTAFTLADVSKKAGKQVEPSRKEQEALKHPNGDSRPAPSNEDLKHELADVSSTVAKGTSEVVGEAGHSVAEHLTGEEQETLLRRLKQAVLKLRERGDYSDSVSALSLLVRRYLMVYSRALADTAQAAEEDIDRNPEADRALGNFWTFITSLGDPKEWEEVERSFKSVAEHGQSDPEFDKLVREIGNLIQDLLSDPEFFDHVEERFKELRAKSRQLTSESSIRDDLDRFLDSLHRAFHSVLQDADINKLFQTTGRIAKILSPAHQYTNDQLVTDSINVFIPLLVQAVQFLPIPRLEVSTPALDLLLENLILEPGHTVNSSSFFPYKLKVTTKNDVEVRKARFRTTSSVSTITRIAVSGLSIAADEVGYWLRLRPGLFRFIDAGIASFHLDERGLDIAVDLEIGKDRLEQIVALRGVRVKIHHLDYELRKSKVSWLAWLFKPLVRPMVRAALELQIAHAIVDMCHAANREVVFARERLRATRIADPDDLWTFVKAVATRLVPAEDPDLYTRVGVAEPGKGVFRGKYAPGSIVKLWNEEAAMAGERAYQYERDGWRNDIFDVRTSAV